MQLDPKKKVTVYDCGCGLRDKKGPKNMSMETLIKNAFSNKKDNPQIWQIMRKMLGNTK